MNPTPKSVAAASRRGGARSSGRASARRAVSNVPEISQAPAPVQIYSSGRRRDRRIAPHLITIFGTAFGLGTAPLLNSQAAEVAASIHVPPAEVYVLGDDIPLVWRFTNQSTNPLAMLWEGCCRLNGKLAVTAGGQVVDVLPPGASSFHTFSKAETLPPGKLMEFSSRLVDWVRLPMGGEFELGGRYTGVLPSQRPQIPTGLALWTGTATATPMKLAILSVDDYLAQRTARSRERGIELGLAGPDRLPPVAPVKFTATLRNLGDSAQSLDWPGTIQLWLVDERGWRLEKGLRHLPIPGEHLTIPPQGELKREFQLSSADLNGEPFGDLKMFLDLGPANAEVKRLPSSSLQVAWNLGPAEAVSLLNDAAGGPAAGMRNPSLKLLRQYLAALQPHLRDLIDEQLINDRARNLKAELLLAGCVQPLSPRPGPVFLPLQSNAPGAWSVALPGATCEAIAGLETAAQVDRIASIRRHLGWDLTIEAKPVSATPLGEMFALAKSLAPQQAQLAAPLTWRQPQSSGLATNQVQFPIEFPAANVVIRLRVIAGETSIEVARKPAQPNRPAWLNLLSADEVRTLPGTKLADSVALKTWLALGASTLQPVVLADESVVCGELLRLLQPLIDMSLRISIIAPRSLP